MTNNKSYMLLAILILFGVGLFLSFYPASVNDEKQQKPLSIYSCKTLSQGCEAYIGSHRVELKFPEKIIFLERFPVEIRISGFQKPPEKVTIDFQMVGMNMGINIFQLKQDETDPSLWSGTGVLPICTTGRTDWQAIVSLQGDKAIQQVAFQFEVTPSSQ